MMSLRPIFSFACSDLSFDFYEIDNGADFLYYSHCFKLVTKYASSHGQTLNLMVLETRPNKFGP